jgi:hypothetical protein
MVNLLSPDGTTARRRTSPTCPLKEAASDGGGADEAHADRPMRATASMMGNVHVIIEISFVI